MKLFKKMIGVALLATLTLPVAAFAQPQDKDDKHRAEAREGKEGHPVIREAIKRLEAVKYDLEHKAASDFKGHKAEAIRSINEALEHLHQALQADPR